MSRLTILQLSWPMIGMCALLTMACLGSIGYISRLQSEIDQTLHKDSELLNAAQQTEIYLRAYHIHYLFQTADPSEARQQKLIEDRQSINKFLNILKNLVESEIDRKDLAEIESGWQLYEEGITREKASHSVMRTIGDLLKWGESHRVRNLLDPCERLSKRALDQMEATKNLSKSQTFWAGWALILVGFVGPLAGLIAGFAIARRLSHRMAQLSVRIQAVQSHLDLDVGDMTLERAQSLADLDHQLEHVVDRVRVVCQRLQEQERNLLRAEQLAAVGHLAAGVAHEVRNPLTGMKMLVESAIRPVGPTPLTQQDLEMIRDEIARLERTIQGLLDFAKPHTIVRIPSDVRDVISRAAAFAAARAQHSGVAIQLKIGDRPQQAKIDPDQFASLLSNLIINALDASPRGATVEVECGRPTPKTIQISVKDRGPGIPDEMKDQLFSPFTTSKPAGTGLGLAIAQRVALDHHGTLTATNREGGGATLTVTVPAWESDDAEAAGH
ncbi:MAG: ATP-binding protein [Gemmataceae bacterium]